MRFYELRLKCVDLRINKFNSSQCEFPHLPERCPATCNKIIYSGCSNVMIASLKVLFFTLWLHCYSMVLNECVERTALIEGARGKKHITQVWIICICHEVIIHSVNGSIPHQLQVEKIGWLNKSGSVRYQFVLDGNGCRCAQRFPGVWYSTVQLHCIALISLQNLPHSLLNISDYILWR